MRSIRQRIVLSVHLVMLVAVGGCSSILPPPAITDVSVLQRLALPASARWQKLTTVAYRGKQDDISFIDNNVGWYGNGAGDLYRTLDGGDTWVKQFSQPGLFVRALGFVDEKHGFLGNVGTDYYPGVTETKPLFETVDGGQSWRAVNGYADSSVKGICAIDILKKKSIFQGNLVDRVIVHAAGRVGGPAFILRSLDGGKTFQSLDINKEAGAILDIKFFDEMNGFVFAATNADPALSHALILRTKDGGATWTPVYVSKRPYELTWKASFPTRDVGYVTIQSYDPDPAVTKRYVAKTEDGGATWSEIPLIEDASVREFGIGFINERIGWVGTNIGGFQTVDGGRSWARVEMGKAVNKIRVLPAKNGFVAYAIGVDVFKLSADYLAAP